MNKNIVLIQSHCNNDEKKNVLLENIKKLRNYDLDILLFSHITLPEEIISEVDYFIYSSDNPIMWEERRHLFWESHNNIKYQTIVPDYGWTVFNQIIKSYDFISKMNYEFVYIFCYDLIVDEIVIDFLKNPRRGIFIHEKPDINFDASLVFSVFEKEIMGQIVGSFSRKEYSENWDWIAEKYFEEKLKSFNLYEKPTLSVKDLLHESKDIFNMSQNEEYSVFLDNQKLLRFKFFNKTNKKIKILIDDRIIDRDHGEFVFIEDLSNIEKLGCLVEDRFDNWFTLFKLKRTNSIISL